MPIKPIQLEKFIDTAKNVHEAIVAASKRARQLNDEQKIEFNQRIEMFLPKTETETEGETDVNPDQLKVSLEFERRPKPTDMALNELMDEKLEWYYKESEEVAPPKEDDDEGEEE